jgi:hypothetical protein
MVNQSGKPLEDIRTQEDNAAAADFICNFLRDITADENTSLHVSIAGGRKTMGYYLGYALSLFGREQDKLSHVLVSPQFENSPQFYYPTPYECGIDVRVGDKTLTLDARKAEVSLAEIPFVRLRHGQPRELLIGHSSFSQAVQAAQQSFAPPNLILTIEKRQVQAGDTSFHLPPNEFALLLQFAQVIIQNKHVYALQKNDFSSWANDFIRIYQNTGKDSLSAKEMSIEYFRQLRSKLHRSLKKHLGENTQSYLIQSTGKRGSTQYSLALPKHAIHIQ